jgi:hypothetical protein
MRLHLIPCNSQIEEHFHADMGLYSLPAGEGPSQVDGRTARQWLQSAITYCNWRAGDSWRRLSDPEQRNSPERDWYLSGSRTLLEALNSPERQGIHIALPVLNSERVPDDIEKAHALRTRAELVRELMALDSKLTDARLLSHLPRPKLAHMLRERELRADAERMTA